MRTRATSSPACNCPTPRPLQRTERGDASRWRRFCKNTPGVKYYTSVVGYSMLSGVQNTYSGFFFITLEDWAKRKKPEEQYTRHHGASEREVRQDSRRDRLSRFRRRPFPASAPRAASRSCWRIAPARAWNFLAANLKKFLEAAHKRPEIAARVHHGAAVRAAGLCGRGPRPGAPAGREACRMFTRRCNASWAARS